MEEPLDKAAKDSTAVSPTRNLRRQAVLRRPGDSVGAAESARITPCWPLLLYQPVARPGGPASGQVLCPGLDSSAGQARLLIVWAPRQRSFLALTPLNVPSRYYSSCELQSEPFKALRQTPPNPAVKVRSSFCPSPPPAPPRLQSSASLPELSPDPGLDIPTSGLQFAVWPGGSRSASLDQT